MRTVKTGRDFTGYVIWNHRKCGHKVRLYVGRNYFQHADDDGRYREMSELTPAGCEYWKHSSYDIEDHLYTCKCGLKVRVNLDMMRGMVYGRYVEEKVCDGRCMGAIGQICECQCGGMNHGGGHGIEVAA